MAGLCLLIMLLTLSQTLSFYVIAKRLDAIERAIKEFADVEHSIAEAIYKLCKGARSDA